MEARTAIFTLPTSVGDATWSISGWDKTPVAAKVVIVRTDATDGADNQAALAFGVTDGTDEGCLAAAEEYNLSTSNQGRGSTNSSFLYMINGNRATELTGTFSKWVTGGIEITFAGAYLPDNGYQAIVTFYTGTDVNAAVRWPQRGEHITDLSFTSKLIHTGTIGRDSETTTTSNATLDMGVVANGSNGLTQTYTGRQCSDGSTSYGSYLNTTAGIGQSGTSSEYWNAPISSIDSTGFNVGGTGTEIFLALCLDFDNDVDCGYSSIPTSGNISITDPGFTPQIAGLILSNVPSINTCQNTGDIITGIGEADGTRENSLTVSAEDAVSPTDNVSIHSSNILHLEDADGVDIADGTFDEFTSSGFDITVNTNPSTARYFIWWAIEEEASGDMTGDASGSTAASGEISGDGAVGGDTAGSTTAEGTLAGDADMSGEVAGSSEASGDLSGDGALAGDASGSTLAEGTLVAESEGMSGSAEGSTEAEGNLSADAALSGEASGETNVSGTLSGDATMEGDATGGSSPAGDLKGDGDLQGDLAGGTDATGTLSAQTEEEILLEVVIPCEVLCATIAAEVHSEVLSCEVESVIIPGEVINADIPCEVISYTMNIEL